MLLTTDDIIDVWNTFWLLTTDDLITLIYSGAVTPSR